jgi:hypothetical protein
MIIHVLCSLLTLVAYASFSVTIRLKKSRLNWKQSPKKATARDGSILFTQAKIRRNLRFVNKIGGRKPSGWYWKNHPVCIEETY